MHCRFTDHLTKWNTFLFCFLAAAALWQSCPGLAQSYAMKMLYNFNGSDSEFPYGLTMDSQGNLYGSALRGGSPDSSNNGMVYKYSAAGVLTTLAVFDGLDGHIPSPPMIDAAGNLWGTTAEGGVDWAPELSHYGWGTLYKISSTGVFTPGILEFTGPHGANPTSLLTMDISGNLIGSTGLGGDLWNNGSFGLGTVFQVSPTGVLKNPVVFNGSNGVSPSPPVTADSLGNLYGTTSGGGLYSNGALYKISPSGVYTILVSFNSVNGKNPGGTVAIDSQGNLYGTTSEGGVTAINNAVNGYGTIWKWSPTGGLTTLASFNGTNGMFPGFGVTMDAQGNLFGVTSAGGTTGNGVVFEYSADGVLSTLVDFDGASKGGSPDSPLCMDSQGNLYGVTNLYGPGGYGSIFAIRPVITTLSVSSITVSPTAVQGGATAQGTVTISGPAPAGGMVVTLGSNNSNVTPQGPVTIPTGATSATFTVSTQAVTDNTPVAISARLGSSALQTTLTVAPPATAAIAMIYTSPYTFQVGQTLTASVLLNRVAPAGGAVVTLASDTATTRIPSSVTVPAGALSAAFPITSLPITVSNETTITATLGTSAIQAGFFVNPPTTVSPSMINLSVNFATVQGGTPIFARVFMDAPAGSTLTLTSNSPAVVVPASITVQDGGSIVNVPIQTKPVASDTVATITAGFGANTLQTTVTVLAPTPTTISSLILGPTSVQGGHSSEGRVFLGSVAPAGGVVIALSSSDGAAGLPATVAVPEGETFAAFAITTKSVPATTTATITATVGSSSQQALLTITPGIPGITLSSFTVNPTASTTPGATAQGGSFASGTVFLSAAAPWGGALVTLTSSDPTVATVPATVVVPAGFSGISFFIPTRVVSASATVTLTATFGASAKSALLTVSPVPSLSSVSFSPATVTGGQAVTGTVTLSGPAPAGGEIVTLVTPDGSALMPATVTVAAGATSASFSVTTFSVAANTTATVVASAGGSSQQATLTMTPISTASLSSLTLNPMTVPAGGSSQATLTLSSPAPTGGAFVNLTCSNGAVATLPASITIPAGAASATFTVTSKSVTATTTVTVIGVYLGVNQTALLTITPVSTPADTVSVAKAEYTVSSKNLHVEATSNNKTAVLRAYVTSTGALIGSLTGDGSGHYKGDLNWASNPQNITVKSSLGGSASLKVTPK